MHRVAATISLAALMFLCPQSASAQKQQQRNDDLKQLRQEVESLKKGQEEIQNDLQEIKKLLQARVPAGPSPAPPTLTSVSMGDNPFLGNKNARVVLLDFSDYQCPFCGHFVRETMPKLEQEYIKTGKVKYVFRDLPLEAIHPFAFKAAEAVHCAGEQSTYWEMHYRLFLNQKALDVGSMPIHAQALGLELATFTACLNSGKYAAAIRKDMAEAASAGITGTPNFVIGLVNTSNPNDRNVRVLQQIVGSKPYETFKAALDSALAAASK